MMDEAKPILTKQLASIFGFEDGLEDILEMLLTIEGKQDLKIYLEQLLGKDKDTQSLIEDIGRVQQGQMPLTVVETTRTTAKSTTQSPSAPAHRATPVVVASSSNNNRKQAPATNVWQPKSANSNPTTKKQPTDSNKTGKPPGGVWSAQPKPNSKRNVPPAANQKVTKLTPLSPAAIGSPADSTTSSRGELPETAVTAGTDSSQLAVVVAPPKRGKPNVVCGCFGNVHKPLANCLYCGRISCEREGYSYCAFCGNLVEQATGTSNKDDGAWQHKERLLRYDRESAQRTVIIDDQADYYSSSAWLTAAEDEEAREAGQIHYDEKHRRGRTTMKLNIG